MGRTLTQLLQGVGRRVSPRARYVTAHGTGGAGSYTSTKLSDVPNDWYNGMWFWNDTDALEWRVTDFVSSTGALTLSPTTTPTSTSDYELHAFRPTDMVAALNDAAQQLSDVIVRTRVDDSYVTDSPLFNAGFEDTTSLTAITGWAASTVTMNRDATAANKLGGAYSLKTLTAAGYVEPSAEFQDQLLDLAGQSITVYCHVKTSTTSAARLRIVANTTTTSGSYHSGGGGWETISVTATIPSSLNTLTVRLVHDAAAATINWDNIWIEGGPRMYQYRLPSTLDKGPGYIRLLDIGSSASGDRNTLFQSRVRRPWAGWRFAREEDPAVTTTRNILRVSHGPPQGRWLMVGWEPLNVLSVRADVAEISEEAAELLETKAAMILIERSARPELRVLLGDLARTVSDLKAHLPETMKVAML